MSSTIDKILFFVQGGLQYTRLKGNRNKIVQYFEKIEGLVKDEIKRPKRNCDVGTAESQTKRFFIFCGNYGGCEKCPCYTKDRSAPAISCYAKWSQMPYEKGGDE